MGSDLDLVIIAQSSSKPFMERTRDFDTTELPVPVDLLVYTQQKFETLPGNLLKF
ncbi:MAG: hypothetical protein ABDK94_03770 [Atribacterota bacterium]